MVHQCSDILSPFRNKFGSRHESHEQTQVITNKQTADSVSRPSLKNITNLGAILWARLNHQKQQFGLKTPDRACTFTANCMIRGVPYGQSSLTRISVLHFSATTDAFERIGNGSFFAANVACNAFTSHWSEKTIPASHCRIDY